MSSNIKSVLWFISLYLLSLVAVGGFVTLAHWLLGMPMS